MRRRAIVLVLVMIVIVMVSLAGFSFVATMTHENKAVHVRGEQLQMEYVLDSAEEFLKQYLRPPQPDRSAVSPGVSTNILLTAATTSASNAGFMSPTPESSPTTDADREALMRGVVVSDDGPLGRVRFTVLSPRYEEIETNPWTYGPERESARLDLHAILAWETQRPGLGRQALLQLPGATESIADAVLDWMDADRAVRPTGAEDDYYATLNPPYAPRQGVPESLEELLLIKGVTRSMVFGDDADQNHRLDWNERSAPSANGTREPAGERRWPWAELLTLHSGERNQSRDGQPRINLNDPSLAQLHARLVKAFDTRLANYVVLYRQYGPVNGGPTSPGGAGPTPPNRTATPALRSAPTAVGFNLDASSVTMNFTLPGRFLFRSPMDLLQSQVPLPPTAGKSGIVSSPVPSEREAARALLAQMCDRLTTTSDPVLRGGVNLNLAPAGVLQMIPGIDPTLAAQIVAARTTGAGPLKTAEPHPCALYLDGQVDANRWKELFPYLTTGGDLYRAQVVAFSEASRLSQRVEILLDATRTPVVRILRKDLQVLGRGVPWDVLDTPAGIAFNSNGALNATPVSH